MFSLLVCFLFAVTHCTNRAYSIATISLTGDVLESLYKADHALSAMKDRKKLSRHYLAAYRLSVGQNVTAFLDTATTVTAIASNDDSASMETVKDKVDEISKCHNKIKACNAIILPLIGTQEVRNEHDKATIVKITDNSELKYNAIEYLLSDYLSDVKINKSLLTQSTGSLLLDAYNECTIESNRNSILTTSAQKMWYLYSNKYRQFKHIRIRLYNYNKEQNKLFYEGKYYYYYKSYYYF